MRRSCYFAFTLIELLIVVAIIAVLAAIAVPNFLEAQTRSKISRLKSDLRTTAMAIRAYEVEWTQPMPSNYNSSNLGFHYWWIWLEMAGKKGGAIRFLTTPVSYISTIPVDIFNPSLKGTRDNQNMAPVQMISFNWFYVGKKEEGKWKVGDTHGFQRQVDPIANKLYGSKPYRWSIFSPGPDLVWYLTNRAGIYDPTNGTISGGEIGYFDSIGLFG